MYALMCPQDGYPAKVFIQWFRVIDAYYTNNTLPLNVTTIDIADIKSTIQVRPHNVMQSSIETKRCPEMLASLHCSQKHH